MSEVRKSATRKASEAHPKGWRFTSTELVKCAQREASYRRYIYPRRVEDKRMTRAEADREIAMMDEIAERLKDQQRLL
jgi:hypothetical protein